MKKTVFVIFVLLQLIAIPGAQAIHETMPAESVVALPGPYADAVYKYISVEDSYKNWELWPGKGRLTKGKAPFDYVTTYVNENALFSINAGKPMVNGSLIVTENYNAMKKLTAIFVMYKVKGYNHNAGDWFWAKYAPGGKPVASGKVSSCISCHSSQKTNDYIFTEKFVK